MLNSVKPSFGVAGFPPNFFKSHFGKKRENIFEWLNNIGLNWIELQNTYGVKMKDEQAHLYSDLAKEHHIGVSIHAPYYITLASKEKEVRDRSKERILQCFDLAMKLNSKHIIFHPGHFPGTDERSRREGIQMLIEGLLSLERVLPADDIFLYPETAGKKAQLGSIEEIIEICSHVKFACPCIDVAHVHAFRGGTLTTPADVVSLLDLIEERLGATSLHKTHFHMYPIEVDHTGEKKHKAFSDRIKNQQFSLLGDNPADRYFPLAEHFAQAIATKGLTPSIICEARDSQDTGALLIKKHYEKMQ
ncbi:TIM barrel protein [Desulfovibrio desulfuricans]|uniref:TIM barrel protein n=1 Tax=Desulfovibrio desulfuricans TaxID=876 RepID=UPI001783B093|nr:TIM barrel protein [Desulfovibrio desulfuricans]MBD8896024.1 TIM barrel protein [Desulfovibrio desulfuricans]